MSKRIVRRDPVRSAIPTQPTLDEQAHIRLHDHVQRLRLILPVISVLTIALRKQKADLDDDIASVHRHASDPLDVEIDKLEALLEALNARRASGDSPSRPS
jgi:hypothetical protein